MLSSVIHVAFELNNVHLFCKHSNSVHQFPVWTLSWAGEQNVTGCIVCGSVVRNFYHVLLQKPCIFVYPAPLPYCQNSLYNNLLTVMWLCIWITSILSHNIIFTKTVENLFFIYPYYTQHKCNEVYMSLLLY
jgi:hypothetical protein